MHRYSLALALLLCSPFSQTQAVLAQAPERVETAVTPLATEDINGGCHYVLTIPQTRRIRAVWVIFDRGRDVHDLAADPDVIAFARRFNVALLLQSHCPGRLPSDHGDMNMIPAEGLGPALLRALDQFAKQTSHPELSAANLILLGFSGAGPLAARLIGDYPHRVLAGILSAPGHFPPQGIETVSLNEDAQKVPELIIADGADDRSGTQLPYQYFQRYRRLGAPWTFVAQNRSPHCCTANVKLLILDWLSAVLIQRTPAEPAAPLRNIVHNNDWLGYIQTASTTVKDSFGLKTFNISSATIRRAKAHGTVNAQDASWLPNAAVAREWLSFVQQPSHPILPL